MLWPIVNLPNPFISLTSFTLKSLHSSHTGFFAMFQEHQVDTLKLSAPFYLCMEVSFSIYPWLATLFPSAFAVIF